MVLLDNDAGRYVDLCHQLSRIGRYAEAEACCRRAVELAPDHAVAHNNLGWTLQMQGDSNGAIACYETALRLDGDLRIARRNLAILLVRLGLRDRSLPLWREELLSSPGAMDWLGELTGASMQERDLQVAGEFATLLTQARWGSRFYPCATENAASRLPVSLLPRFLTIPKLQHDIEQFLYLQRARILGDEFTAIIMEYERTIDRLKAREVWTRVPIDEEAERTIGDVYNRIVHIRHTPTLLRPFSEKWVAEEIERKYLANSPGVVVVDDFLSAEALDNLRQFCLESTVWSGNRYAHGRLGAFFRDGFNCPLLLQIAQALREMLPRVIGDRYPLRQLWGFKYGEHLPGDSTIHADFAAVNVNFWIAPEDANLDACTGGMVIYGVDAPAHWDFDTYNSQPDRIRCFLRQQQASSITIPYRENRAIIFNSDLFHATDALNFKPGYENRRVNITMLYGDREHDVHHRGLARPDAANGPVGGLYAWRSPAFRRIRRSVQ